MFAGYWLWSITLLANSIFIIPILTYLLLKSEDVGNTTIHRIANPGLSFISNGHHSLAPLCEGHMHEQLRNIACSKDLVNGREARRPLLRAEVRSKDAIRGALASEELAGATGRTSPSAHNSILPITYIS